MMYFICSKDSSIGAGVQLHASAEIRGGTGGHCIRRLLCGGGHSRFRWNVASHNTLTTGICVESVDSALSCLPRQRK